ncbi:MAG: hypothetical protein K1W34_16885 [Lachnospiraceae bacterium]
MDKSKIIYSGLCCKVNTKAAFIDKCLKTPETAADMLMYMAACAEYDDKPYEMEEGSDGFISLGMELNEKKMEQLYEDLIEKRLQEGIWGKLTLMQKKLLEPVEVMHQREVKIDVLPFLVYAIVRNERCREMLKKTAADCAGECLDVFRASEYNKDSFLRKFLLEERKAAKLAAGLFLLFRRNGDEGKYRDIMAVIYAGYQSVKNVVKKLDCLDGERYKDSLSGNHEMRMDLSRMVIQMVIAEDLDVPLMYDYEFCQAACMLMLYEEDFMEGRQNDKRDMEEGKRIYRTFARKHANPGKYYVSAFLENSMETCMYQAKMEELFSEFGVEMGAIAGMYMEKWEAEMICAIFEEKDWEKYKHLLLIATLCKYIQQLETLYESDIPEEIQYRQACEENAVKTLEYEIKRLEQRIGGLEQQRKDKECELAEAELKIERLRREQAKKEAKYEKERAELLELRQLLSCTKQEKQEEDKKTDIGRLGRSVVIGGHRNWQKKMSKCLPNSQFLASDYMNFDPAMLHNKEYIIVNTDILKHGIYYKIMNERRKGQKVLYVHGNNVERTLREISSQLQC